MSVQQSAKPAFTPEQDHRRQAFWQIYLPLALGAAIFIALCVWVVLFTIGYIPETGLPDQQSPAAKVAVIWILLAPCFGGLIQLVILGGMVFLVAGGIRGFPPLAHRLQGAIDRVSASLHRLADSAAKPVISVASLKAGWDRLVELISFWKPSV
jgi:hypothetical protein